MKSMTGYGKGVVEGEAATISVELRSLNGKNLRIRYSIPRVFNPLVNEIQKVVSEVVKRGEVDLHVTYQLSPNFVPEVIINYSEAVSYLKAVSRIEGLTGRKITVSLKDLLSVPEIFQRKELEAEPFRETLLEALKFALSDLDRVRREEGKKIKAYLEEQIAQIEKILKELEIKLDSLKDVIFESLLEKAKKLLENLEEIDEPFEKRVELEVALLAEKQDVSEEISRLKIHLQRFRKLLKEEEEPVGKTLDFLCQEMHREINTLGNKVKSLDVTDQVLEIKSRIAKIKEQVQNVE